MFPSEDEILSFIKEREKSKFMSFDEKDYHLRKKTVPVSSDKIEKWDRSVYHAVLRATQAGFKPVSWKNLILTGHIQLSPDDSENRSLVKGILISLENQRDLISTYGDGRQIEITISNGVANSLSGILALKERMKKAESLWTSPLLVTPFIRNRSKFLNLFPGKI